MTTGELAYLLMVIGTVSIFATALFLLSTFDQRR